MNASTYGIPEPYAGEGNELLNTLDGERQEIAHALGTEHPLFKLVDGALRSTDIDELRVARAATNGWPSGGRDTTVLADPAFTPPPPPMEPPASGAPPSV